MFVGGQSSIVDLGQTAGVKSTGSVTTSGGDQRIPRPTHQGGKRDRYRH